MARQTGSGSGGKALALLCTDAPSAWTKMGFHVDANNQVVLGDFLVKLGGTAESHPAPFGLPAWAFQGVPAGRTLLGVPTFALSESQLEEARRALRQAGGHPNTAVGVDHLVIFGKTKQLVLAEAARDGLELRRERELGGDKSQLFFRPGQGTILEVLAGADLPDKAASFALWGLTLVVQDIEAAKRLLGEEGASKIREAVQRGRRILTVRSAFAGSKVNIALMTPHVAAEQPKHSGGVGGKL